MFVIKKLDQHQIFYKMSAISLLWKNTRFHPRTQARHLLKFPLVTFAVSSFPGGRWFSLLVRKKRSLRWLHTVAVPSGVSHFPTARIFLIPEKRYPMMEYLSMCIMEPFVGILLQFVQF